MKPERVWALFAMMGSAVTPSGVVRANNSAENSERSHRVRDAPVFFRDIAATAGVAYRRTPSTTIVLQEQLQQMGIVPFPDVSAFAPMKPRGIPGIAVFDADRDGDLDIYVTNGPGTPNSLYRNQLKETGQLTFVDVGSASGVGATDMDSTGVVYADFDNDGDHDLYVLGRDEDHRLFDNLGDGTFRRVPDGSDIGGGGHHNPFSACTGDVDNDGRVDIFIANSYVTWENRVGTVIEAWGDNDHNQLLMNRGGGTFEDISVAAGMEALDWSGVPAPGIPAPPGAASASLACGMVDYDMDGDIDIIFGDDQGGLPGSAFGGTDRGFIHVMNNDGRGVFTDVMRAVNTQDIGGWMGFSFGDFNGDRYLDFFATNAGPFLFTVFGTDADLLAFNSSWYLGKPDRTFELQDVGALVATPFGWGVSTLDYDNDADQDIVFHGSHDTGPVIEKSNPGTLLRNDGRAVFSRDVDALSTSTDHRRRGVQTVAVGDLNNDGFVDIVTASNMDFQPEVPILPFPEDFGGAFDADAGFIPTFQPIGPGLFEFSGFPTPVNGTLAIEINGGNRNNWLEVEARGTLGLTRRGSVNRDAIGAIISLRIRGGRSTMMPVLGGSSFASQDSLAANFGMGRARRATVDVFWPGGVRNRLYDVRRNQKITFPEIPCSFDDRTRSHRTYRRCVTASLRELVAAGALTRRQEAKFFRSAMRAFHEERRSPG